MRVFGSGYVPRHVSEIIFDSLEKLGNASSPLEVTLDVVVFFISATIKMLPNEQYEMTTTLSKCGTNFRLNGLEHLQILRSCEFQIGSITRIMVL